MRRARPFLACSLAVLAVAGSGCAIDEGTDLEPPKDEVALHNGAELFHERCGGCHTLKAADTRGSRPEGEVASGERTNGPNFDVTRENREDVLFAIRNGGFSGAIMPANIVVGEEAENVALFLERYAGSESGTEGGTESSAPNAK